MADTPTAALIMAGGRSERMRAGGSDQHKGLRTVGGMPLIECNLRTLLAFGFTDLFVAVNAQERALREWIDRQGRAIVEAHAARLTVLVETAPLGTIGAVALLPPDVSEVVIVNVDNLTTLDLRALARFHQARGVAVTVATHQEPFAIPFGMLELEGERVVAYREKPKLPVTISSGVYVLSRRAIDRVIPNQRLDVPTLIELLLRTNEAVVAFPHHERWIDINDEAALAIAQRLFATEERALP